MQGDCRQNTAVLCCCTERIRKFMQIPATVKSRMQFVLETSLPTVLLACKLYALNTRML